MGFKIVMNSPDIFIPQYSPVLPGKVPTETVPAIEGANIGDKYKYTVRVTVYAARKDLVWFFVQRIGSFVNQDCPFLNTGYSHTTQGPAGVLSHKLQVMRCYTQGEFRHTITGAEPGLFFGEKGDTFFQSIRIFYYLNRGYNRSSHTLRKVTWIDHPFYSL
jgi:hypothetical protein